MWLFVLLRDILSSCLKPSEKITSSSSTDIDGNNVSTTDNSKQNSTDTKMKKCKTNTNKLDNNVESEILHTTNTITELDVSWIEKDDFIEPDDNEIQILIDIMNTTNKQAKQNKNCNNNVKLPLLQFLYITQDNFLTVNNYRLDNSE